MHQPPTPSSPPQLSRLRQELSSVAEARAAVEVALEHERIQHEETKGELRNAQAMVGEAVGRAGEAVARAEGLAVDVQGLEMQREEVERERDGLREEVRGWWGWGEVERDGLRLQVRGDQG